jgi:EmrB/QacA subfamily drug resistance transporter
MAQGTIPIGRRAPGLVLEPVPSPEREAEDALNPRRWLTLAVVLPASFLGTLDFFIVNVALPSIQADLGASPTALQFVIAAYGLAYAVCLITGGRLGDLYGRKRAFLGGVALFTVASGLCGCAPHPLGLIAARALQGVSGALMFPQVLSIIHVSFPPRERGLAFGLFGSVQGAAALAGILLGGLLVEANIYQLGWRPIFLVNLPLGVLTLLAAGRLVRESRAPLARRLDLGGVALVSIALALLVLPLSEGRGNGWPWWLSASSLVGAVAILAVFVQYERWLKRSGGSPLVELTLFRERTFVVGILTSLSFCGGLSAFFLTVTMFLQQGMNLSPGGASWVFAPFAVGYLAASSAAVNLAKRLGTRILNVGVLLMAGSLGFVLLLAHQGGSAVQLALVLLFYGIGQGLVFPKLISTALSGVPASEAGSASGVLMTFQQVAFAFGVAVIGSVFFANVGSGDYVNALTTALSCNLGLLGVTFVLAFFLPEGSQVVGVVPVEV